MRDRYAWRVGLLRSITRFVTFISCECGETIDAPSSLACAP
jgi:hypothetical protein